MIPAWLIIIAVLACAVIAIYLAFRSIRRRELAEIKRFEAATPNTDDDFLIALGLSASSDDGRIALAIRSAIAELGQVPTTAIRANHRFFPDLEHLPFYDSIDFVGLILETETKTGVAINSDYNDRLYEKVVNGTVRDYVLAVLRCMQDTTSQPSTELENAK